jgi:nitrogen fixation protein NifU and related proteins
LDDAVVDRQEQIEILLDHFNNPRGQGQLDPADVTMPGGNPGCGDVITVYLRDADGQPEVAWEGEGCTISMASASILAEMLVDEAWSYDDILNTDYTTMIDILGKEAVQMRPKCATLALGTLKAAVRKLQRDQLIEREGLGANHAGVGDEDGLGIVLGEQALDERGRGVSH